MNGMNIGADASIPSRRSWITCPISWTSRRITKPAANDQPQMSEYAAIETSIVAEVESTLIFGSRSRIAFALLANAMTATAIGPRNFFARSVNEPDRPPPGWMGS